MNRPLATLQNVIYEHVWERGYLRGDSAAEVQQQLNKALEELGEVARCVFDGKPVPFDELADVCIPIFCIAALQDRAGIEAGDLVEAMVAKVAMDADRGRRDRGTKSD